MNISLLNFYQVSKTDNFLKKCESLLIGKEKIMERKGEKIGWICGWLGGFIWLGLLSIMWFFQSKISYGIIGIALFIISVIIINIVAPWKHPDTKYWKLMIPIYLLLFISIVVNIIFWGGMEKTGLKWASFFWIFSIIIPFFTLGNMTWGKMKKQS